MQPITFKRIEIRKPRWNNYVKPTTTNNQEWQYCLFVVFEINGIEYDWMPKWHEFSSIKEAGFDVEQLNKILCKEAHEKENKINDGDYTNVDWEKVK